MSASPPLKANVRNIISIFENQTVTVDGETSNLVRRTKSLSNLASKPTRRPVERQHSIEVERRSLEADQISQQIRHLQSNLGNYKTYSRETHVYYQNQIIFILTDVANISLDLDNKSELTEQLKKLNKTLNARLPASVEKSSSTSTHRFEPKRPKEVKQKEEPPREEVEEPALSVKSLKQLFEKNADKAEGKREFGSKLSRKYPTFNSTADFNYVKFSEKFKENHLKKQVSFVDETSEEFKSTVPDRQTIAEEKGELTPDSLSNEDSADDGSNSSGEETSRQKDEEDDF